MFGCQCIWALGVIYEVASSAVRQTPESAILLAGADITFHCTTSSVQVHSDVEVYWWRLGDETLLQPDSDGRKRFFQFKKETASFQILNVRFPDAGVYYCGIRNTGNWIVNGTGSRLVVHASPEPVRLIPKVFRTNSSVLKLVCETAQYYPESLNFIWYKNDRKIVTGISTVQKVNSEGMFEASSRLKTAQASRSGAVYTCMVSHRTLQSPAMAVYFNSNSNSDHGHTPIYLQISGYAGAVLIFLALVTFIVKKSLTQ